MTKRTTEAYVNALRYVNDKLIPLEGKGIIMDFEKAMRAAMKIVAPNLPACGCLFHHIQALIRKMRSFSELYELIRTNDEARALFRKYLALALLPASLIETAFKAILKETFEKFTQFAPFVSYYNNEWIKIVKPKFYSVFKRDTRTTGAAEAFNGKINKSFRTHGTFFAFVESLQKEEAMKSDEFERDVSGTPQRDDRKNLYKKRAEMIETYSDKLSSGKINWKYFVNVMSNLNNKILYEDNEMFLNKTDVDMADDMALIEGDDTQESIESLIQMQNEHQFEAQTNGANMTQQTMSDAPEGTNKRKRTKKANNQNIGDNQSAPKRKKKQTKTTHGKSTPGKKKSTKARTEKSTPQSATDSDSVDFELMDRVTRNGSTILRLQKRFEQIENQAEIPDPQGFLCVICCERKKSMILYPCLHQHTCEPCWFFWKVRQLNKIKSYDEDLDDESTMPKCPMCRQSVEEAKRAIN